MKQQRKITKIIAIVLLMSVMGTLLFTLNEGKSIEITEPNQATAGAFPNFFKSLKKIINIVKNFFGQKPNENKVVEHSESVYLNETKTFNIQKGHKYDIYLQNYIDGESQKDGLYYITHSASKDGLKMAEYSSTDNGSKWSIVNDNSSITVGTKNDNTLIDIFACYKPMASEPSDSSHKLSFTANITCTLTLTFKIYKDKYTVYDLNKKSYKWESIYSPYCKTGRKCTQVLYLAPGHARILSKIWTDASFRDKIKLAVVGFNGKDVAHDVAHSAIMDALDSMSLDMGTSARDNVATMCGSLIGSLCGNVIITAATYVNTYAQLSKAFKSFATTKKPVRVVIQEYVFNGSGYRIGTNSIEATKTSGNERTKYGDYKYILAVPAGCIGLFKKI